jgi:hypothetical protein
MPYALCSFAGGNAMKTILDQMEEHIAAIRNLQRNFDFHSKRLEKLMRDLSVEHCQNCKETQTRNPMNMDQSPKSPLISERDDLEQESS